MFDQDLISQLRDVFKALTQKVRFVVYSSQHPKQQELLDFLSSYASTHPLLEVVKPENVSTQIDQPQHRSVPGFFIELEGKHTGVEFRGIPGGHEFTSLVVATLNSNGIGKLPDAGLNRRIKTLRSGLEIRTYMSLSCENCPDVVQAMNQIAMLHGSIRHTTIDGAYVQDELAALKVQGVPAVFVGDKLIHSGKSNFAELLTKLEEHFLDTQINEEDRLENSDLGHFDAVVVGGGPAGVSSAIYLVRKGLKTAIVAERIGGQMLETKGIENFISNAYTEGVRLSADLEKHIRTYPVTVFENRRVESVQTENGKSALRIIGGETLTTDSLIIATGAKWRELGVPGEKEYIGRGVAFCPHCDGPYYKGKKVVVVGGGNSGVEAAIDLAGICSDVTLLEFSDQLRADKVLVDKLRSLPNTSVIMQARTSEVVGNGEKVVGLQYEDRSTASMKKIDCDGIFVQIGLSPNSAVVRELVETTRSGEIVVDQKGHTSVTGIYAAGDVTTVPYKQIVIAMGEGAKVALTAFEDRMRKAS